MKKYEIIKNQVTKSSIAYSILKLDNSLDIEDITNDIYLILKDKKIEYIHSDIKQALINIYNSKKRRKNIHLTSKLDCENTKILSEDILEKDAILDEGMKYLLDNDDEIHKLTSEYFIHDLTYQEIGKKYNIPFRTVKYKIDKGLAMLKEYYKE